ncbi:MAG: mycofactocin biosynthesis glycosyltransferase MftF [Nocardioides sp.]|uniref:mycofactocin biosynthesis glycosyltransferase MftF n=1 Tax=Nocardioides sp. TaxID=35761 RepID=UPI0039E6FB00
MSAAPLPPGFRIRLRPEGRLDAGRVLVGGSPLRAVRLARSADELAPGGVLTVRDAATAALARKLLAGNLADPAPGTPADASLITVVVPVRDRSPQLDRCLAALEGLSVVVVDDASRDRAAVAAVAARHGAELLRLDVNVGPASARNAGLTRVRTPLVAFVDSDVRAPAMMLRSLGAQLVDPRVALAGPIVRGVAVSARVRWWERYDEACSALTLGRRPCAVQPGAFVSWLPSACLVGRTEALRAVGGFAEGLRVAEDVDLVWRLVAAGHGVRYQPEHVALHEARSSLGSWLGRKVLYGSGGAVLAERHGGAVAPAVLSPAMGLAALAVMQRRWWSIPAAAAAVGWGTRSVRRSLPPVAGRDAAAGRIATQALGWALFQEADLVTRHWWPGVAVACLVSRGARRTTVSALVVDAVVQLAMDRPRIDPATGWLGRRLDDLAYGAGLWLGALRARSLRCLAPRFVTSSPRRRPAGKTNAPH